MQLNTDTRWRVSVVLAALLSIVGCGAPTAAPRATETAAPAVQQLRISNTGAQPILGLTVRFPGETSTSPAREIAFGDVAAGVTSGYQPVPHGVYRYAAYSYTLNGKTISQAVTDWVGEQPLPGTAFTYQIALDPAAPPGGQVTLLGVQTDRP